MRNNDKNIKTYLAHRAEFIDYATAIVGERAQGEDVVQDAFFRLHSTATDRDIAQPVGYFRRIIRNLAIDWLRSKRSERQRIDTDACLESVAEERPSQEEIVSQQLQLRVMSEALAELPERTRIALEMHRFDGRKLKEIASALDISVTLAHSLVYEGLAHCRQRMMEKNGQPD
ncbi:sigma-70 family RNA polymerase sigma factor [Erwinia sp. V71]|uniref:sigma-70 family RNA polymerase sigma factor n=1 Tax=Erwinia sp. V71 TaxID=3369424 RepID=UPI003F6146DB